MRTNITYISSMVLVCAVSAACSSPNNSPTATKRATGRHVSDAQLEAFGRELVRFTSADVEPPEDIAEVVSGVGVVSMGTVVSATVGRKEFLGVECVKVDPEDEDSPCLGGAERPFYASYVNLVVRPTEMMKGRLPDPNSDISVEFSWPNNRPIDGFLNTAPIGARVVVIGDSVTNAEADAEPLTRAGVAVELSANLLSVPPYGLVVETEGGSTALPLDGSRPFAASIKSKADSLASFDETVAAIRTYTAD